MAMVSCVETTTYGTEQMYAAVKRHLDLLGFQLPAGAKVLLKPNLIMRAGPGRAATTHPALVEAVAQCLWELGAGEIVLADSPGGPYLPGLLEGVYETSGMREAAQRCGIRLNTNCASKAVQVAQGEICREFDVIDPVLEADVVVNLCKLKTHCMTTLSCGVKNLFGVVPGLLKPQLHYRFPDGERFAKMLVDLSLLVRPALTLVDGVEGMEGNGPTGGQRRYFGITLGAVGMDLYALDLAAAWALGLGPEQVPVIAEAVQRGLCPKDFKQVHLVGDPLPRFFNVRMPESKLLDFTGHLPGPLAGLVRKLEPWLAPHPKIRTYECVGCGRCAESCPAKTITIRGGKAQIGKDQCIRCFCCQEMCPVRAIDIQTSPIFRFLSKFQ